jgi:uncharacterized membrane protein
MSSLERSSLLDFVRGFAVVLMVAFHLIWNKIGEEK